MRGCVAAGRVDGRDHAGTCPAAEVLRQLRPVHAQVDLGERLAAPDVDCVVCRPCREALAEEGLHLLERGADGRLLLWRHLAHEHEDGLVAVVGEVWQRRRDSGAVGLELLVKIAAADAEGGLECLLPCPVARQGPEETQDGLFAGVVDEPVRRDKSEVVPGGPGGEECVVLLDLLQRRRSEPDQCGYVVAELAIELLRQRQLVGGDSDVHRRGPGCRPLDHPCRPASPPVAAQGLLEDVEVLVRVGAREDALHPCEHGAGSGVCTQVLGGRAPSDLNVRLGQGFEVADVA